jgi:serine/threonine protein kinase
MSVGEKVVLPSQEAFQQDDFLSDGPSLVDGPSCPLSDGPSFAATAKEVLGDEIVRVWTDGLTGAELELEPLTDADVAATGCPAQDRYRDPRKRVPVEDRGRCVGDAYDIKRTLGFGGFASVREGKHIPTQQDVCVKVIGKDRAGKTYATGLVEAGVYEMLLEISKQPHRNVVRYFDIFESTTRYYVAMEQLQGCELTVALTEYGPKWSEKNCAGVMFDLLTAMSYIHQVVGIYHRDVKLENLRFRGRTSGPFAGRNVGGGLVLLDFGLCRFIGQPFDGRYAGTQMYKPPEVSLSKEDGGFSCAVDLWAAGIVLFILLTGDMPFEEKDALQGLAAERAEEAIASFENEMAEKGRDVPQALLRGLLQADPALRWDATRALKDEWLELAPDLPAAETYAKAIDKSKESSIKTMLALESEE